MFRSQIEVTPLTTEFANEYYKQVYGDRYNYDSTLVATGRALVTPRMKPGDWLRIRINNIEHRYVREKEGKVLLDSVFRARDNNNELVFVNITGGDEDKYKEVMDKIEGSLEGYTRVERATLFFQKVFQLRCYINEERRMSFVITGGIDTQRFHYMQCGILAYLPWYFPEASELDKELITSMRQRQPDEYLAILQRIADESDMESMRVEKLLKDFQKTYYKNRYDNAESHKISAMNDLDTYRERISNLLDRIEQYDIEMLGLMSKMESAEADSGLADYFKAYRKVLRLVKTEGNYVTFETKQYLDIYDEDILENMLRNKNSYIYSCAEGKYTDENIEKIMRKIFMEKEFRIRFCCAYRIDLRGAVHGLSHYNYDPSLYGTYMPNPHINEHSCLGNYERMINEILTENDDYTVAIDQCLASGRSLNWADTVVTKEFLRYLYKRVSGVNVKCIELPNGSVVDIDGAFEYMKEQEKKGEE